MSNSYHRFSLGQFQCTALSDGNFNYPLPSFFANAPADQLNRVLVRKRMPTDHVSTPYTCLFVDTGAHRVMVDTGAGALGALAPKLFPSVDHSTSVTGLLLRSMEAAGIEPGSVDTVVITHAHPDHIGGTLHQDGTLVFNGAQYFVARDEWEFWMSDAAEKGASAPMVGFARRALEPLRERVKLFDDAEEIVPGIQALAAPGHTPGHTVLSIRSGGEQLLHISDTVLHPLHLEHPEWTPAFDTVPEHAAASKQRVFTRAARERALIFSHHFPPFPSVGWVVETDEGWEWRPRGDGNGTGPSATGAG